MEPRRLLGLCLLLPLACATSPRGGGRAPFELPPCVAVTVARGPVSEVRVRCPKGTSFHPAPVVGRQALAGLTGPRRLQLLDAETLALTSLDLPAPADEVRVWANGKATWVVGASGPEGAQVLYEHDGGWRTATPLQVPPGSFAKVVAAAFPGWEGAAPRLWLETTGGERFVVDPPGRPQRSESGPPAGSTRNLPSAPAPEIAQALPPPQERGPGELDRGDESKCQGRRVDSVSADYRHAHSQVLVGDERWVLVLRATRERGTRQRALEFPVDPVGGQPPPPRVFQCVWEPFEELRPESSVHELATLSGGYRARVELPGDGVELLGASGADLFLLVRAPPSATGDFEARVLKVDTRLMP